jgi:hypothetical protein
MKIKKIIKAVCLIIAIAIVSQVGVISVQTEDPPIQTQNTNSVIL